MKRGRSTGNQTRVEAAWIRSVKHAGCVCCAARGYAREPDGPLAEAHHLLSGGIRRGHAHTVGLCAWHHRGRLIVSGWTHATHRRKLGPSLADGFGSIPCGFRRRRCADGSNTRADRAARQEGGMINLKFMGQEFESIADLREAYPAYAGDAAVRAIRKGATTPLEVEQENWAHLNVAAAKSRAAARRNGYSINEKARKAKERDAKKRAPKKRKKAA